MTTASPAAPAPRRVVVVGASAAGLTAVETLRREGFDGSLVLVGREPHLPYDRPPLSKQVMAGEWSADRVRLRAPADLDALDTDLRLGTAATALSVADRTVTLSDGTRIGYDALVVATGVRPRRLPPCGTPGVHVLRDLEDALALRDRLGPGRRLVVIGAGFLGSEAASSARALGCAVTLVDPAPVPLAHAAGRHVGDRLARLHRGRGVELRLNSKVTRVDTVGGRASAVRLSDATRLPADAILVAVGSVPNTEWLQGSGLRLEDGVVCDAFNRAAPGVYAAGDVARWHNPLFGVPMRVEHRTNAAEQAMSAARNLLRPGQARPFAPVPYFWSEQYGTRIQAFGHLRGHEEARVFEEDPDRGTLLVAYRTGPALVGALSVGLPAKALRPWRAAVAARTDWAKWAGRDAEVAKPVPT